LNAHFAQQHFEAAHVGFGSSTAVSASLHQVRFGSIIRHRCGALALRVCAITRPEQVQQTFNRSRRSMRLEESPKP
jgi:hypothetical protein